MDNRRLGVLGGGLLLVAALLAQRAPARDQQLFGPEDKRIQYMGRVDFSNPKLPRFWAPGVTVRTRFQGSACEVELNDQVLWGKSHNYVEYVVDDGKPVRVQTTGATNTIKVADGLAPGAHTLTLCKDTEDSIGYLELVGIRCQALLPPPPAPTRKLEFIGDSITCGSGSDLSKVACDKGEWYDQANAYHSYGAATARRLGAQWNLSSVSGIGLMHSCCDMKETMPDVWGYLDLKSAKHPWDFNRYRPDAVMICLGQNDGKQDADAFTKRYMAFLGSIRSKYPNAHLVCLTSPMADDALLSYQKTLLSRVVQQCHNTGNPKVHFYAFGKQYHGGCGGHPDVAAHARLADELAGFLQTTLAWNIAKTTK